MQTPSAGGPLSLAGNRSDDASRHEGKNMSSLAVESRSMEEPGRLEKFSLLGGPLHRLGTALGPRTRRNEHGGAGAGSGFVLVVNLVWR